MQSAVRVTVEVSRLGANDGLCCGRGWLDCLQSVFRVAVDGRLIGGNRCFVPRQTVGLLAVICGSCRGRQWVDRR